MVLLGAFWKGGKRGSLKGDNVPLCAHRGEKIMGMWTTSFRFLGKVV